MKISVLKEVKLDETRVALRPDQVSALRKKGHEVFVEMRAGANAGYSDTDYISAGAKVSSKKEVLDLGELILKVKAPIKEEYNDYGPDKILFTYLHLDENIKSNDIKNLISSGVMGIAYEWVGENDNYPILTPMSRLTGYLFAQKATELCAKYKGIFVPKNENFMTGGKVLILGAGNIGLSAIKYFLDLNVTLSILCKNDEESLNKKLNFRYRTDGIDYIRDFNIQLIEMDSEKPLNTQAELKKIINEFDIIINCAVRRSDLPKSRLPYLITKEMVKKMGAGSVICDATACDGDLIETCFSSPLLEKIDIFENIIHYNCDHIPSLVAKTATKLLSDASFPFICSIADKGVKAALEEDQRLSNGIVCYKGNITHKYTADKKGFPYCPISDLV